MASFFIGIFNILMYLLSSNVFPCAFQILCFAHPHNSKYVILTDTHWCVYLQCCSLPWRAWGQALLHLSHAVPKRFSGLWNQERTEASLEGPRDTRTGPVLPEVWWSTSAFDSVSFPRVFPIDGLGFLFVFFLICLSWLLLFLNKRP